MTGDPVADGIICVAAIAGGLLFTWLLTRR